WVSLGRRVGVSPQRSIVMGKVGLLFLLVFFFFSSSAFSENKVSFPGHDQVRDPTGRYIVVFKERSPDLGGSHELILQDRTNGIARPLLDFDRHVDLLWAPSGSNLAVTDWTGSSDSQVLVFFPDRPSEAINMETLITEKYGYPHGNPCHCHMYYEAIKWRDKDTLLFK